jgi:hypothetical protein
VGKQSRRKQKNTAHDKYRSRRRSDPTSAADAFVKHMNREMVGEMLRQLGDVDHGELTTIAKLTQVVIDNGKCIPLLVPLAEVADHSEFDGAVCECGVRDFVRPGMPSDIPGAPGGKILEFWSRDPSITPDNVATVLPPPRYVRVIEEAPGRRRREFGQIKFPYPPETGD